MKKIWKPFQSFLQKTVSSFNEHLQRKKAKKEKELEKINQLDKGVKNKKSKFGKEDSGKINLDYFFIFKFWIIFAIVLYLSYILYNALDLLYLIVTAFIISFAMESIIEIFQKFLGRSISILISYIFILTVLISGIIVIIPFVLAQTADIIDILLDKINEFQVVLQKKGLREVIAGASFFPGYMKDFLIDSIGNKQIISTLQYALEENVSQMVSVGSSYISNVGSFTVGVVKRLFSTIFQIVVVFTLAVFFSLEKNGVINFLSSVSGHKEYTSKKIHKLYKKLGFRLKGQLLLTIFIGVMVGIFLYTLSFFGIDLPNKFTLALIAGITEFIPILGPIMGAIPALMLAIISYGFKGFFWIAFVYIFIQWAENHILLPVVMNQALGISALLIFLAIIVGGAVLGFIGVILAVPIAVVLTLVFEDFIEK